MTDKRSARSGWASSIVGLFTTGKVEKPQSKPEKLREDREDTDVYPSSSALIDMRPKIKASGINRTRSILNELEKLSSPHGSKSITPRNNDRHSASFSQNSRPQLRSMYTPARVQEQSFNLSRTSSRTPYSSFPYARPDRDSNVFRTPVLFRDIPISPRMEEKSQMFETPRSRPSISPVEEEFSMTNNAIATELDSVPQITLSKPLVGGFLTEPIKEVETALEFNFLKPILRDPNANAKPLIFPEDDNSSNSETDGSSISPQLQNPGITNNEGSTKENVANLSTYAPEPAKWEASNGPVPVNARPKLVARRRIV